MGNSAIESFKLNQRWAGDPCREKMIGAMKKKLTYRKIFAAAAVMALLIAAILYGATMLEQAQQSKREEELQAQGKSVGLQRLQQFRQRVCTGDFLSYILQCFGRGQGESVRDICHHMRNSSFLPPQGRLLHA